MHPTAVMSGRAISADLARWRRRSRRVLAARILLPAAIVGLLVVVVTQVGWRTYMAATHPPAEAKTEIRLITPRFYGQSTDGRSFMITARSAIRDDNDPRRIILDDPALTLDPVFDPECSQRVPVGDGVHRQDRLAEPPLGFGRNRHAGEVGADLQQGIETLDRYIEECARNARKAGLQFIPTGRVR